MSLFRLRTTSSILLLAAALSGCAGSPPATSSAAKTPAAVAPVAAGAAATAQAVPAGLAGAASAAGQPTRVVLPGPDGKPFPYTIELPAGWQVQSSRTVPGVFLGPAGAGEPENDVRMIYVRVSPASLLDPEAVVANIKKSDAADDSWSAPLVEVREIGGVRGVLVRMDSGSGDQARSTLVLKMPFGQSSVDFMASAPRAEFEGLLPAYQSVILSVLPVR
ncbi:MAG TPA: hypothetical protein VKY89_04645 [Thermoanaerobaculia bacterium]|nr:hypothetical protein [Thermoanaerobaculia bacterium]